MTGRWTDAELRTLVAGRELCLRDPSAADLPVPAWLVEASAGCYPYDSVGSVEAAHPDDRGSLIDSFLAALFAPGEPQVVEYRARHGQTWHHLVVTTVNLADHAEVGGVLICVEYVDGPAIEEVAADDGGEQAPTDWMVITLDTNIKICSVEGKPYELLGYRPEELVGRSPTAFMRPESVVSSVQVWISLHANPEVTHTTRRPWTRKDGSEVWLENSYVHRGEVGPDEGHVFVVMFDITERRAKEAALREREEELRALAADLQQSLDDFRLLADEVPTPVFRCDHHAAVRFRNARWDELLGDRAGVERLHDLLADESQAALTDLLEALDAASDPEPRSLEVVSADGETVWRLWLRPVGGGATGRRSFMGSLEDVTANVRLLREASCDALTGLANRAAIDRCTEEAVSQQATDTVVVFIDLDGFKPVNDTYGHDAGDAVLVEVGRRLQQAVRPADVVGRYGGDEFVVLCRSVADEASETAMVERLTLALGGWIDLGGGRTWEVAASIGVTRVREGDDAVSVLHRADQTMYEVKRARSVTR